MGGGIDVAYALAFDAKAVPRIELHPAIFRYAHEFTRAELDAQLTKLIEQRDTLQARMDAGEDDSRDEQVRFADDLKRLQSWWVAFLQRAEVEPGRRRYGEDEEWLAKESFIKGVGEEPQSSASLSAEELACTMWYNRHERTSYAATGPLSITIG